MIWMGMANKHKKVNVAAIINRPIIIGMIGMIIGMMMTLVYQHHRPQYGHVIRINTASPCIRSSGNINSGNDQIDVSNNNNLNRTTQRDAPAIWNTVYTYYESMPSTFTGDRAAEPVGVLSVWQQSWQYHGWHATVIDRSHARAHPRYDEFMAAIRQLPTVNSREYEDACYLRWLAMATVGGGWMSDYDMINRGFLPTRPLGPLFLLSGSIPSLVSGTADEYTRVVDMFIASAKDPSITTADHQSDMLLLRGYLTRQPSAFLSLSDGNALISYANNDDDTPLVHVSAHSAVTRQMTKHILMEKLWQQYLQRH